MTLSTKSKESKYRGEAGTPVRCQDRVNDLGTPVTLDSGGSVLLQFFIDKDHHVVSWNKALECFTGIRADQLIGTSDHWTAFYSEKRPCLADILVDGKPELIPGLYQNPVQSKYVKGAYESTGYFSRIGPSGKWLHFMAMPIIDSKGTIIGAVETLTELTGHKYADKIQCDYEALADTMLSGYGISKGIIELAGDKIVDVTKTAELSSTPGVNTGLPLQKSFSPRTLSPESEQTWCRKCEESRKSNREVKFDFQQGEPGTEQWFSVTLQFAGAPGSLNPRFVYVIADITEKKRNDREDQLVRQKLELMNIVAWHDVLNKITGLRGYVELTKDLVSERKAREFIQCEEEILQCIHDEITFTIEYQDMGTRPLRWMNVRTAIHRALSACEDQTLSATIETGDLELFCDPIISRMFTHLIDNTKKYGKDELKVRVYSEEKPGSLLLVYEDNSSGIPENKKQEIFVRGVGKSNCYGLIFVHDILEISGICIRESGTPSGGARFEMEIPAGCFRFGSG